MAKGVDFAVYAKIGVDESTQEPIFKKVAGQRGGTFNRSRDTVDYTSKDSEGWKENDYSFAEWSIEFDGLLVEDDEAYMALEDAFNNQEILLVYWQTAAGHQYQGNAILTDFPQEGPYDGEATYSGTLTGTGKPTKIQAS